MTWTKEETLTSYVSWAQEQPEFKEKVKKAVLAASWDQLMYGRLLKPIEDYIED